MYDKLLKPQQAFRITLYLNWIGCGLIQALLWHLPRGTQENHEKLRTAGVPTQTGARHQKRLKHTATLTCWMKMQQPAILTGLRWGFGWDATPSRLFSVSRRFEGSCCPYCRGSSSPGRISSRLLDPASRRHYVPSKSLETLIQRPGVTSQKTRIVDIATVQTLNLVHPYYSS